MVTQTDRFGNPIGGQPQLTESPIINNKKVDRFGNSIEVDKSIGTTFKFDSTSRTPKDDKEGFFEVVERVGLDHVTKERQLIRSTRESFDEGQKLPPLKFAGLIMEGGVIGYESNNTSGGVGARYLGIGTSKSYRRDTVQISLRTVSVTT